MTSSDAILTGVSISAVILLIVSIIFLCNISTNPKEREPIEAYHVNTVIIKGDTYYSWGHGLTPTPETIQKYSKCECKNK